MVLPDLKYLGKRVEELIDRAGRAVARAANATAAPAKAVTRTAPPVVARQRQARAS